MKINSIGQTFEAKKFRLPVNYLETEWGKLPVDCAKEFDNPAAEDLYNKAQKTKDLKEKINLLSQMGDYKLVDGNAEKTIKSFFEKLV